MKEIFNLFSQPFPYFRKKWPVVAITTTWVCLLFVLFFLIVGFHRITYKTQVIAYFTLAAFAVSATVTYLFPLIFKRYHSPENWTKGKYYLFCLSISSLMSPFAVTANHYVTMWEGMQSIFTPFERVSIIYAICVFVGILPTVVIYIWVQKTDSEYKLKEMLSKQHAFENIVDESEIITLSGSTRNELKVVAGDFLYAEVLKNYVTIYYMHNDEVVTKSLRTTLSQITESFEEHPQIVRCHRAFIVNTSNIVNISGNSRGYQLTLNHIKTPVPASRSYVSIIREMLNI